MAALEKWPATLRSSKRDRGQPARPMKGDEDAGWPMFTMFQSKSTRALRRGQRQDYAPFGTSVID